MKNRSVTLSLLTATLFAIPAPAAEAPGTTPGRPSSRRGELIQRFDQNGDGQVDGAERQAAREKVRASIHNRVVRRFDGDGDGQLNDAEKAEARSVGHRLRQQMKLRLMRHRAWLLRQQPAFLGSPGIHRPGGLGLMGRGHGFAPPRGRIMERFDRNSDGRLDENERQALREAWEKFRQQ